MNIFSLPALISFAVNFSLAFIVLMEKPRVPLNRWFAAFIFSFAVWNVSEVIILNSASKESAFFWAQMLYRIIFLSPAFFVIISYQFPKNFHSWAGRPIFYVMVFALPVIALSYSFPDFHFRLVPLRNDASVYYFRFECSTNPSFLFLLAITLSYLIWGNTVLIRKLPRLRMVRMKNQTKFFTVGMIIVFLVFLIIYLIRPYLEQTISFYFLSTLLTFLIAVFFFVAIVQFHLFRPSHFLRSGVTYGLLSTFVLAVYFFLIKSISAGVEEFFSIDSYVFDGMIIFILLLLIRPFERRLQQLFDRLLNKDLHQQRKNFLQLVRELQRYHQQEEFFQRIKDFMSKRFKIHQILTYVYQEDEQTFVEVHLAKEAVDIPADCYLVRRLMKHRKVLEFYELESSLMDTTVQRYLEKFHASVLLPLIFEKTLLGFCVLSHKKYGLEYSEDEFEMFNIFASEIAGALQRNQMIEELREHDRRDFQLEKLASLGQLTAGIAHEIRNPLNTISTSAETLLQPEIALEDRQELQQFIIEEIARLNNILTDFLNLSRIRPPSYISVEVQNIMEWLQLNLQTTQQIPFQLKCRLADGNFTIFTDRELLQQALLNLALNARSAIAQRCENDAQFTCEQGLIECSVNKSRAHILFSIADNGIGIPEEIKNAIFDPFFTTRQEGTGLGLSIVRQIIDALGGKITFDSHFGYTKFTVELTQRLPLSERDKR